MQILNTKFHIPTPDQDTMVQRKELLAIMSDADTKGLVLIQAPAGFGKTTFLTQWIKAEKRFPETAWISLEKRDNVWVSFWTYVIRAFHKIVPHVCDQAKQLLEAGQIPVQEDLLITIINALEKSCHKFILVLDDFHLISDRMIHNGINFLIDHPIDNLLIIIATRKSPHLELARLRISGRLKEINERQLRFSKKETIDFIKGFFPHLPHPMQTLMARISIASRFTLPLVRALSNHDSMADPESNPEPCPGQSPIEFMQRHHLLLIPLDDTGQWFRFHHLFQQFLKKELTKQGSETRVHLHIAAFKWFEQHDLLEEAFSHGLKAGREDLAARFFATHLSFLYGKGGEQALMPFFNGLSLETITTVPILACYYYAMKIFNGQFEIIEQIKPLVDAAKTMENRQLLTGFHTVFLGYYSFYRTGNLEDSIEKCLLALELIPKSHGAIRRMIEFTLTLCYRLTGKIEPARLLSYHRKNDNLLMSALSIMNRSLLEMELGNLAIARNLVQTEIRDIEQIFDSNIPSIYGFLFVTMGMILKEENQMLQAQKFFSKGISIIEKTGFPELIIISYGEYAVFLSDIRKFNQAHKAMDHAIAIARQSFSWIERLLFAQKRQIWLKEKKLDLVRPWAEGCALRDEMEIPFQNSPQYLVLARYYMDIGQWDKIFQILDPMIRADQKDLRNRRLMECLVLKSKALVLSGHGPKAVAFLTRAIELSRNQGYIQLFLNEMKGMEGLYQSLNSTGDLPPHLTKILENNLNHGDRPLCPRQVLILDFEEKFNTRELDILKLFQQGVSNKEAAATLNLSVNTVRWYASKIFIKLRVKRRGQAVSEAARLKLI